MRLGLGPVLSVSEVLESSFSPLLPLLLEEDRELFVREDVEESLRPPLPSFSESDLLPPLVSLLRLRFLGSKVASSQVSASWNGDEDIVCDT